MYFLGTSTLTMTNDTRTGPIPPADAAIIVPDYLRPDYEALRDSGHSVAYCLDRLGLVPERGGDGRYSLRKGDVVKGYVHDWACFDGPRFVAIVERDGDLWAVPARLI
jgi:hypothetical protein